jgi:hypothetical protein
MAIRLKIDDLCPDGARIVVNWNRFAVGSSIFIPCVDVEEAKKQVLEVTRRRSMKIKAIPRVENGMFGVRFWRLL